MTLAYKKMFLDVTLEAVDKGHFTFLYVPSPMGSFFMPFLQIYVYRSVHKAVKASPRRGGGAA